MRVTPKMWQEMFDQGVTVVDDTVEPKLLAAGSHSRKTHISPNPSVPSLPVCVVAQGQAGTRKRRRTAVVSSSGHHSDLQT